MLLEALSRNWWMVALRGVVAILFGIIAFTRPGTTLGALVILFGVYALLDGILALVGAVSGKGGSHGWALVLEGIVGLAVAAMAFLMPGLTAITLLYLIAAWAIGTGILEIIVAIRLRKEIKGEWLLVLSGIASLLFGMLLVARPGSGALAVIWLIGGYAIAFGVILLALAFKLKSMRGQLGRLVTA